MACISALPCTGAKQLVSEIVRTDLERLIRCRGKSFYSVKYVFRGRVFYLRQGNTRELKYRPRIACFDALLQVFIIKGLGRMGIEDSKWGPDVMGRSNMS